MNAVIPFKIDHPIGEVEVGVATSAFDAGPTRLLRMLRAEFKPRSQAVRNCDVCSCCVNVIRESAANGEG
jgi:hypothetical protein